MKVRLSNIALLFAAISCSAPIQSELILSALSNELTPNTEMI